MTFDAMARPSLGALARVMTRHANLTFGGGSATTEVLRRALVGRRWMANDTHALLYGLSRLTPGTNLLAYCTAVGWLLRGAAGAATALLAASLPSAVIAVGMTVAYDRIAEAPIFAPLLAAAMAVALFFLFSSAWQLARPYLTRHAALRTGVTIGTALGLIAAGVAPVNVLFASAAVGALLVRPS